MTPMGRHIAQNIKYFLGLSGSVTFLVIINDPIFRRIYLREFVSISSNLKIFFNQRGVWLETMNLCMAL